jgi:hypothetical protein
MWRDPDHIDIALLTASGSRAIFQGDGQLNLENMMRNAHFAMMLTLGMLVGCRESNPTALRPTASSRDATPSSLPALVLPTDTSQLVALPRGLIHRSCLREVPDRSTVAVDGTVTAPDGRVIHYPPCVSPGFLKPGSPEIATSPWPHGLDSWGKTTPPSTQGFIEGFLQDAATGHTFTQVGSEWTVPPKPISYTSGNVVFIWNGAQNNQGLSIQSVAQPVLQLGNNGIFNPGNNWIGAIYVCQGPADPCYKDSTTLSFTPGDQASGLVYTSNCSGGKCDVNIEMDNNTTLLRISYTLAKAVATNGQTNDSYTQALFAALETANLSTCDNFPVGPISFSSFVLADNGSFVTPSGGASYHAVTPDCGYGAIPIGSTAGTLGDSATTWIQATISGPATIANGDSGTWSASITWPHTGVSPYTYVWSGILSGTSSSVSGVPSGSGTLQLTVTDASGKHFTSNLSVTVCAPGLLTC